MVSGSVSLRYSRFFSPFPHGTGSLSVSQEYLALADGPARFTQGFPCPALLRIPLPITNLTHTGLSPAMARLSRRFRFNIASDLVVLQPPYCQNNTGLDSSTFARRYSQNHYCFLLLRLLRCFSSPGLLPTLRPDDMSSTCRVAPFGHPRIISYVPIPADFRSLSRPSSPLRA